MEDLCSKRKLLVICRYHPNSLAWKKDNDDGEEEPALDSKEMENDNFDKYNHPRYRRALILRELLARRRSRDRNKDETDDDDALRFKTPSQAACDLNVYRKVHTDRLIEFLETAWDRWDDLGNEGQDPMCNGRRDRGASSPALIPGNNALPREHYQRPSRNVMGQMGFFCTDTCTPIFGSLLEELRWDAATVEESIKMLKQNPSTIIYALGTHPGHHSAADSFGGYCYVNHSALAAKLLQERSGYRKVAILDVDYHCGNGTASIYYHDPSVLMVSIHCHPNYEYPFHSGFYEEIGDGDGKGTTLHVPLLPGTTWETYSKGLNTALENIQAFGAQALVVSLGLDTYLGDPCAIRRAGFNLEGQDYTRMGKAAGSANLPTIVVQEGGYKMNSVPQAATDFLLGICAARE